MGTDSDLRSKVEAAARTHGAEREAYLRVLTAFSDGILRLLPELARSGDKGSILVAIQVLARLQYPDSAPAIPFLASSATDPNLPGAQLALDALGRMPAEAVAPSLIRLLLDRGRTNGRWQETTYGVCALLLELGLPLAALCGPTLVYLLGQAAVLDAANASIMLDVLQAIGPAAAAYALPTLIIIAHESAYVDVRQMAERLLRSFAPPALEPYAEVGATATPPGASGLPKAEDRSS